MNWYVNFSTAKPVVINGTYSCVDSDPATWSQDQQSGGKGFCTVYVVNAVKKALEIQIDEAALSVVKRQARRRGVDTHNLIERLIEKIAEDELFSAVLDR